MISQGEGQTGGRQNFRGHSPLAPPWHRHCFSGAATKGKDNVRGSCLTSFPLSTLLWNLKLSIFRHFIKPASFCCNFHHFLPATKMTCGLGPGLGPGLGIGPMPLTPCSQLLQPSFCHSRTCCPLSLVICDLGF